MIPLSTISSTQPEHTGDGLDEYIEKWGPVINLRVFWADLFFTASPEHIKLILATDFENYVKGLARDYKKHCSEP